jgi:hypothetical protein
MLEASTGKGLLENWKCLLACTLVSMSPFQYGIDFGAIGGLQAMPGFLKVSSRELPIEDTIVDEGLRSLVIPTLPALSVTISRLDDSSSCPP